MSNLLPLVVKVRQSMVSSQCEEPTDNEEGLDEIEQDDNDAGTSSVYETDGNRCR